jgi:TolB-like protein
MDQFIEFGPFRYDREQRLLFRDGETVSLTPKALETLHVLLERRGQVVEKDNLMKLVWPDTTVEEVGLARNISLLRKALGGDVEDFIETIPKRGYRFAAAPPARRPVKWAWVAAMLAAAASGFIYWQFYAPSRYLPGGPGYADLAVIPFEPLSTELSKTGFSRSFNELLVTELSKVDRLHVISPSTVRRYQWVGIGPQVMARVLGVEIILEGTVQGSRDRLRVTTRLADVHSGKLIWAESYDQPPGDAALAHSIALEVGKRLREDFAKN